MHIIALSEHEHSLPDAIKVERWLGYIFSGHFGISEVLFWL